MKSLLILDYVYFASLTCSGFLFQCVQVKIDIGHKSVCRTDKTEEGYTHDWVVFVRGTDSSNISHFVEKVVFHLHESFPKPKRGMIKLICFIFR